MLTILFLRFLRSAAASVFLGSSFFFLGFSNFAKSILSPVIFGPDNFLYCVSIASAGSVGSPSTPASSSFEDLASFSFTGGSSFIASSLASFFAAFLTTGSSLTSSTGVSISDFSSTASGFLSKSILPIVLGPESSALALITLSEDACRFSLAILRSSCSLSKRNRSSSFSFCLTSATSLEATFLLLSV